MPKFTKNIITAVEYKFRRNSTAVKYKFLIINEKKSDFLLKLIKKSKSTPNHNAKFLLN